MFTKTAKLLISMLKHENYYEIEAENNYELGLILGTKFKTIARRLVSEESKKTGWGALVDRSKEYLVVSRKFFPDYIAELEGYAKGAEISFDEFWTRSIEDEVSNGDKCTTIVTNGGAFVAHNEDDDFGEDPASSICILKKKIGKLAIFELFYFNTSGGNAVSVNSHGFLQAINTLHPSDKRVGIPKNLIGRWFSETDNPEEYFKKLASLPRASGFNHVILNRQGKLWNVETSASKQVLSHPNVPVVHTNHYLSGLSALETNFNESTIKRFESAKSGLKKEMSVSEIEQLMSNQDFGVKNSILNERTIARCLFNFKELYVKIWLKKENKKGSIDYDFSSIF